MLSGNWSRISQQFPRINGWIRLGFRGLTRFSDDLACPEVHAEGTRRPDDPIAPGTQVKGFIDSGLNRGQHGECRTRA